MIRKCLINILNNVLCFESFFLGIKLNLNLIKNLIFGLLVLYFFMDIFFFGLVYYIIKIEEKKLCNIWLKIG